MLVVILITDPPTQNYDKGRWGPLTLCVTHPIPTPILFITIPPSPLLFCTLYSLTLHSQNTPRHFLFGFPLPLYIFSVTLRPSPVYSVPMIELQPTAEHPVPYDLSDEQPKTHADSIAIAINTVDLINELGPTIDFDEGDLHRASDLITGAEKPKEKKTFSKSAEAGMKAV